MMKVQKEAAIAGASLGRKSRIASVTFAVLVLLPVSLAIYAPAAHAQSEVVLHSFAGTDGATPYGGVIQGSDGNFYGTTTSGGAHGGGIVFKLTPSGTLTILYSFCSQAGCPDGQGPFAGVLQGSDGNFYGTTEVGGANAGGTVFKLTPSGTLSTLYSFCSQAGCTDGEQPAAGVIQGSDGNFYGTTAQGGANLLGAVFKLTPSGTLTTLYSFCSQVDANTGLCLDGAMPEGGLIQGSDGNFYGTTMFGGPNGADVNGDGTVFKLTPAGTLTTLYSFGNTSSDGVGPVAGVVQGSDGNFYGTTSGGPGEGTLNGTVFKLTPAGAETVLYSFCSQAGCADGQEPIAGLIQGNDGNFYGTTTYGGADAYGTVFKLTSSGALTTLYSFGGIDGANPNAGVIQGNDGNFYGTTTYGGATGHGTVFELSMSTATPTATATGSATPTATASSSATATASPTATATATATPTATATATATATTTPTPTATATAVPVKLKITPKTLKFGKVTAGTGSSSKPVKVTNVKGSRKHPGVTVIMEGASASENVFSVSDSCPTQLAAGAACTINVSCKPPSKGTFNGTLSIEDNATGTPQTVALNCVGK